MENDMNQYQNVVQNDRYLSIIFLSTMFRILLFDWLFRCLFQPLANHVSEYKTLGQITYLYLMIK